MAAATVNNTISSPVPGFRCTNDSHSRGRIWYNDELDLSVFEDVGGFYAWNGGWEAHDTAEKFDGESFQAAVNAAIDAYNATATKSSVYQHEVIRSLCREAGISVWGVASYDSLPSDVFNDCGILDAVSPEEGDTAETYLQRVCDAVAGGDVAATIALRRMFGLGPFS